MQQKGLIQVTHQGLCLHQAVEGQPKSLRIPNLVAMLAQQSVPQRLSALT